MFEQTRVTDPYDSNRGKGATPTVKVECEECPDGFMLINKSDFNPKEHSLFESEADGYASKTKPELVAIAEEREIDASGTKAEIVARLEAADAEPK